MQKEPHRATARVLDILETLTTHEHGLTLTEFARLLDAPKSSLFPILHTLETRHYLRQTNGGKYTMGASAYVLGASFDEKHHLETIAHIMQQAVQACGETCQLGILDGAMVLYIEKVDSTQPIRMISKVGNRLPANSTAIGKALLSGLSDEEVQSLYANGLPKLTEHTIVQMPTLLTQLQSIRMGALAYECEESTPQLACFALPLVRHQTIFAALSISVPLFRLDEEKKAFVAQCLQNTKKQIETLAESRNFTFL